MGEEKVRIYIDKTVIRCKDCPFISFEGEFGWYVCMREDLQNWDGPINIDQANFVIPHNCPFRKENKQ